MEKSDMELARSYFEVRRAALSAPPSPLSLKEHATSVAFANYEDPTVSMAQRLLEFEVAKRPAPPSLDRVFAARELHRPLSRTSPHAAAASDQG